MEAVIEYLEGIPHLGVWGDVGSIIGGLAILYGIVVFLVKKIMHINIINKFFLKNWVIIFAISSMLILLNFIDWPIFLIVLIIFVFVFIFYRKDCQPPRNGTNGNSNHSEPIDPIVPPGSSQNSSAPIDPVLPPHNTVINIGELIINAIRKTDNIFDIKVNYGKPISMKFSKSILTGKTVGECGGGKYPSYNRIKNQIKYYYDIINKNAGTRRSLSGTIQTGFRYNDKEYYKNNVSPNEYGEFNDDHSYMRFDIVSAVLEEIRTNIKNTHGNYAVFEITSYEFTMDFSAFLNNQMYDSLTGKKLSKDNIEYRLFETFIIGDDRANEDEHFIKLRDYINHYNQMKYNEIMNE